jgi:hypothetical protein
VARTSAPAVAGGSTDSDTIRDNFLDVARGDTPCTGFAECAELLEQGESIAYTSASGIEDFIDAGEPNGGIYEVWEWADGELTSIDSVESFLE